MKRHANKQNINKNKGIDMICMFYSCMWRIKGDIDVDVENLFFATVEQINLDEFLMNID